MCRYPIGGDPCEPAFHVCGRPQRAEEDGGGSYCDAHARICFDPIRTKAQHP
jgi:hypothetical protein